MVSRIRIVLVVSAIVVLTGCCDTQRTVICPDNTIHITGQVEAYYCGVCDMWNNSGVDPRYTVWTGKKATVSFVRLSGLSYTFETDDSSGFDILLDPGPYWVVVNTAHTRPDTFQNVYVARDTSLPLRIVYDYTLTDSIDFVFFYPGDTFTEQTERDYINGVTDLISHVMIAPNWAVRTVTESQYSDWTIVRYRIPVFNPYPVWQVYDVVKEILLEHPDDFPYLYVDPGFYVCMDRTGHADHNPPTITHSHLKNSGMVPLSMSIPTP
ncbi:MAG: hypothetical protein ABII79_13865 [bacterium]